MDSGGVLLQASLSYIPLALLLADAPPGRAIALRGNVVLTADDFRRAVAAAAAQFSISGARRVILAAEDSFEFAALLFGAFHAGLRPVLPPSLQPDLLARLRGDDGVIVTRLPEVSDAMATAPLDLSSAAVDFFTSGSTGTPKPVTWPLSGLQAESGVIEQLWGQSTGAGPVHALVPHHHRFGFSFKIAWPLASGRMFDAHTDPLWESLLPKLTASSVLVASPAHLTRTTGLTLDEAARPSRVFSAGAPLPVAAAAEAAQLLGAVPTEIFGSTEFGAVASRVPAADRTPWLPLPDIALRVDAESRLEISSPARLGPAWVTTSDLAEPAGPGFHLLGRCDRVVKLEGLRLDLAELEATLTSLPEIHQAAVMVRPGRRTRIAGLVVASDAALECMGNAGFARWLGQQLLAHYPAVAIPRHWRFVASLPVTATGKLDRERALAAFEQ